MIVDLAEKKDLVRATNLYESGILHGGNTMGKILTSAAVISSLELIPKFTPISSTTPTSTYWDKKSISEIGLFRSFLNPPN